MNDTMLARLHALLEHLRDAYSPNTLRAYKADMQEFITYCHQTNNPSWPASPSSVSSFLEFSMQKGNKSSTIRRKVSSISAIHRLSYVDDITKHPEVKITLRKIFRKIGTRFDQAYPVTRKLLDKLLNVCGADLHGLRDRALLILAYDSMRRRAELVSLRVEDMEWLSEQGASILLRRSKTDQHGTGKWIHLSNEATNALLEWLSAAHISEGLLFRGIRPNGALTKGLSDSRVARIFKSYAHKAGISSSIVNNISGHSMRVGCAQDLMASGASLVQIMAKGGWAKTDTVMRYVERVRQPITQSRDGS